MKRRTDRRPVYFIVAEVEASGENTSVTNVITLRHPFEYLANPPTIYFGVRLLWWRVLDVADENAAAFFLADRMDDEARRYLVGAAP